LRGCWGARRPGGVNCHDPAGAVSIADERSREEK
jgi:hypothetical protein